MPKFTKGSDGELLYVASADKSGKAIPTLDSNKWFQVQHEVTGYKPEELEIKVNQDFIKLKGKHSGDDGSRSFYQEFIIADGCKPEALDFTIYANKTLVMTGPINAEGDDSNAVCSSTQGTDVREQSEKQVNQSNSKKTTTSTVKATRRTETVIIKSSMELDSEIDTSDSKYEDVSKEIRQVNEKFETKVNVSEFQPEEIRVRITRKVVVIEAKQVTVTTSTTRKELYKKFTIPQGVKPEAITTDLNPDGVLTVSAPVVTEKKVQDSVVTQQQQQQVVQKQQQVQQQQETTSQVTQVQQHKSVSQVQESVSVRKSSITSEISSSSSTDTISGEFSLQPRMDSTTKMVKTKDTTFEEIQNDGKNFEVKVDVSEYKVEEVSLKVTKTTIKITATHKSQFESRSFYKEFTIPSGAKPEAIQSTMSPDGILTITGPISPGADTTVSRIEDKSAKSQVSKQSNVAHQQSVESSVQSSTSVSVQQQHTTQVSSTREISSSTSVQESTRKSDCILSPELNDDGNVPKDASIEDISKQVRRVSEGKKFEMTLQVTEYKPEEIRIRISKNMVIIEAKKVTESTRTEYLKKFSIPSGVKPETITSSLSPNGVLTISAPIQDSPHNSNTSITQQSVTSQEEVEEQQEQITSSSRVIKQESVQTSEGKNVISSIKSETTRRIEKECLLSPTIDPENSLATDARFEDISNQLCQINEDGNFEMQLDVQGYNPEEIQVKISKSTITIVGIHETKETNKSTIRQFFKKLSIPDGVKPEDITCTLTTEGLLIISAKRTQQQAITSTTTTKTVTTSTKVTEIRPIVDLTTDATKKNTSYEDVTKQIANIDEGKTFEVKLDVAEYKPEELQVRISKNTVVIEGKTKTTTTTRTFYKKFTIPAGVNPENISSSLTPSGTLTISAPVDNSTQNNTSITQTAETKQTTTSKKVTSVDEQQRQQQLQQQQQQINTSKNTTNTNTAQSITSKDSTTKSSRVLKTTMVSSETLKKMGYNFANAKTELYTGDPHNFERTVEITGYQPEEIEIKISGNWVIIEGKQEMTKENGFKSKSFSKMFTVPEGVKPENINCVLNDAGAVYVTAPIG